MLNPILDKKINVKHLFSFFFKYLVMTVSCTLIYPYRSSNHNNA